MLLLCSTAPQFHSTLPRPSDTYLSASSFLGLSLPTFSLFQENIQSLIFNYRTTCSLSMHKIYDMDREALECRLYLTLTMTAQAFVARSDNSLIKKLSRLCITFTFLSSPIPSRTRTASVVFRMGSPRQISKSSRKSIGQRKLRSLNRVQGDIGILLFTECLLGLINGK